MTGNWGGVRAHLAERGIQTDLQYSGNYQDLIQSNGQGGGEYGGKADLFLSLDSGRLGLWQDGGMKGHIEYRHGNAVSNVGNTFFSTNTSQLWPVAEDEKVVATSVYYTQGIGEASELMFGKFNPIDLLAKDAFFGGWGTQRFMNLVFAAPPSGLIPSVFMGGLLNYRTGKNALSLMLFDPNDRTDDYLPDDLFDDGVNISAMFTRAMNLSGRQTNVVITTNYSTADGVDYSKFAPGTTTSEKSGAYNVSLQVTHALERGESGMENGWQAHMKVATADGNPNYVQGSIIAGVTGNAAFLGRPSDRLGVGAYYYDLSDELQNSLVSAEFGDESALEVYYNFALTPWLMIGVDLQYLWPALKGTDNSTAGALRSWVRF